jgi:hypothetical protein
MSIRRRVRATVALVAAYAVALQTILLVFAGTVPGAAPFAATPICSGAAATGPGFPASPGHGQDCLSACLTGCCCGATTVPVPGTIVAYMPEPAQAVIAASEAAAATRPGMTAAHRSRAPPLS